MRTALCCGVVLGFLIIVSVGARAQEAPLAPAPRISRPVAIEVVIAELPSVKHDDVKHDNVKHDNVKHDDDGMALARHIAELEKQGKLTQISRLRLTTLDRQLATVRFSERVPIVTSRSLRGEQPSRGFPQMQSVSMDSMGTLVEFTPTLDDAGILLSCNVEQSRHEPAKRSGGDASDGNANDSLPPSMQTLSMKSIVRLRSGESVLLGSQAATTTEGSATIVVLVTATVDIREARLDTTGIKVGKADDPTMQRVVPLTRIKASAAAEALQLLGSNVVGVEVIGVDERSNTIAVKRVKSRAAAQPAESR